MGELGPAGGSEGKQCTGELKELLQHCRLSNVVLDILQSYFSVI